MISECFKLNFRVPQGSVLGPLLFSLYTSPLSKVIAKFKDVKYHFYGDDSQLFIHISPGNCANSFHQLKTCLDDIHILFDSKFSWLVVIWIIAILYYKLLTTGKPKYFATYLSLYTNKTICSNPKKMFINLKFISTSPSNMMLQNSGMIFHWKFQLLQHYHVSKHDLKPICFRSLFLLSLSCYRKPMIPW